MRNTGIAARSLHLTRRCAAALCLWVAAAAASDLDEFKTKREGPFEFVQKPVVTRQGDRVTIAFETKGFCDVTVAIEDQKGRIVRHLASGVLGPNAPGPFQKDSKKQVVVWNGKNDQGEYIDDKDSITVRVSLGLRALFEKTLFWSPYKRLYQGSARWGFVGTQAGLPTPRIAAAPEGVYVFEGRGLDHLRLFDHQGRYVRTVYPPPPDKLKEIVGLEWHDFPQGERLPLKHDILQTTFLTSGPSGMVDSVGSMFGNAATAIAVRDARIALVHRRVNRLAADGSSGGLPLQGPKTDFGIELHLDGIADLHWRVSPTSAAFSPDGKTLYCTGYLYRQGRHGVRIEKDCLHGVIRIDYESNDPAEVFAGSMKQHDSGTANGRFRDATSVDCDEKSRVYVADYMNDRIQVFSPDGRHLKDISAFKPAVIRIHRKTQEIYVFSWMLAHWATMGRDAKDGKDVTVPARLTKLGSFDDPRPQATYALPLLNYRGDYSRGDVWAGVEYTAEIDSWTTPTTIWLVPGVPGEQGLRFVAWEAAGIKLYAERDGELELLRDFGKLAARDVLRLTPPTFARQRLYVDPTTGLLYVAEGRMGHDKAIKSMLEIDPKTGRIRELPSPFDAEDMAIDHLGRFYFKSHDLLVRYDLTDVGRGTAAAGRHDGFAPVDDRVALASWREAPFDYGEARKQVGCSTSGDGRRADVVGGISLYNGTDWHKGGVYVNALGHIITSSYVTKGDNVPELPLRTDEAHVTGELKPSYIPVMYPGRLRFGEVHVWDERGRIVHKDAVKGVVDCYGVGIDEDDNVYLMAAPTRILDGTRYFDRLSGTLIKFKPGAGKIISENSHLIPVAVTVKPKRPHDVIKGSSPAWVEGAEWMYGGVGYCGKNAVGAGGHCACYNSRFTLDYFARSFAPEVRRFRVAVLDTNGNLITRIGQYGNADCSGPDVSLMHGAYVATDTDHRLFIADPGNARILSVRLDYHATERMPLKDVPNRAGES